MSSSQFMTSNFLMDNQLKQLSAPSIISSTALPSNLSYSASGSSSSRNVNQLSNNFWENYEHLCALQNVLPLQSIKQCLSTDAGSNLTIMADKLKSADWDALLSALRVTKSFKTISFQSNYTSDIDNSESARLVKGYAKLKKPPAIRNKEKTNKLCRALKDCLSVSTFLNKLELFNIPLSVKDCCQIAKGLRANKTVKLLSLDRCLIGDEGLAVICKEIQNTSNLNRVNFSTCNLTHEGANILATLIKVQALKRHNEAWKDSLRYGRPDLDSMFGIRRITINSNQLIGDKGVQYLADAFKSDLWLKALDLQDCGITTEGANHLLDGLKFNAMMHVLDVRLNAEIDRDTLQKIMEQVMINSSGNNTEYEWMPLNQANQLQTSNNSVSPSKNIAKQQQSSSNLLGKKVKKRRNTNTSFTKKSQFNTIANSFSKMKRCKSTGSVICNKSPASSTGPASKQNNGIPWRTAARANRFRVTGNCAYRKVAGLSSSNNQYDDEENENAEYDEEILDDYAEEDEDQIEDLRRNKPKNKKLSQSYDNEDLTICRSRNYMVASSTFDYEKLNNQVKNLNINSSTGKRKIASNESVDLASNLDKIKNVSVKDLLTILQKEQESKTELEDMLLQFQDENNKLKSQLSVYKSKLDQQQQEINRLNSKQSNTSNLNRTLLDDDKALEIIELTLHKYQNFLDFLRNAGFGKLIDIGEMNQKQQDIKKQKSKNSQIHQQELIKQQKKLLKEKMSSGSLSKSPKNSRSKSPHLSDQQKYYLNKINKTKSKLSKNCDETIGAYDFYNSSRINPDFSAIDNSLANFDADNHDIDTLVSNALEISRSFRRFNSSSINNSTMYNNYNYKRNEMLLSEIEETNKENNSNLNESELPSFNEMQRTVQNVLMDSNFKNETKKKKQAITTTSLKNSDDLSVEINSEPQLKQKSNSSISPASTVINAKSNTAPKVQARTSINRNSLSESKDKEIEVEDVSEILSEDDSHFNHSAKNYLKSNSKASNETLSAKSSSDKLKKSQSLDDDDDDNF